MTRIRILLPLAAALVAAAGTAGPSAAGPAAKCKRPQGSELVKTGGKGRVWSRTNGSGDTTYVACSTKYGKKVTALRDDSGSVDQIFHLESVTVSTTKATLVSCTEYEDGRARTTDVANLKTGKATHDTKEIAEGCGDD